MEKHEEELLNLLLKEGSLISEEDLTKSVWFHFGKPGDELPYFYFHETGQGLLKTPGKETEIFWECNSRGKISISMEGETVDYTGLIYKGVFLALVTVDSAQAILLFDSDKLKEQWAAFSN